MQTSLYIEHVHYQMEWCSKCADHSATDALKLGSTGGHAMYRSSYAASLSSIRSVRKATEECFMEIGKKQYYVWNAASKHLPGILREEGAYRERAQGVHVNDMPFRRLCR